MMAVYPVQMNIHDYVKALQCFRLMAMAGFPKSSQGNKKAFSWYKYGCWHVSRKYQLQLPLCDECSLILFSTSTFYQGLVISSPPLTPCSKHPSSQAANVSPPENMYQPMPVVLCLCLSFFFLVVPVRSVPNPYKSWHWESAHFLLGYIIPTFFHYNLHLLHLLQLQSSIAIVGLLQVDVRVKRKTKKKFEQSFKSHVFWC